MSAVGTFLAWFRDRPVLFIHLSDLLVCKWPFEVCCALFYLVWGQSSFFSKYSKPACWLETLCLCFGEFIVYEKRVETSIEKIKRRTSCYIPIANWLYKAYSLFHFETGTTTTVFNLLDNLHGQTHSYWMQNFRYYQKAIFQSKELNRFVRERQNRWHSVLLERDRVVPKNMTT